MTAVRVSPSVSTFSSFLLQVLRFKNTDFRFQFDSESMNFEVNKEVKIRALKQVNDVS